MGPGLCAGELARLPAETVLGERRLAALFGVHPRALRRLAARGEPPPGIPLGREKVWLASRVLAHITARLERAECEAGRRLERIRRLTP